MAINEELQVLITAQNSQLLTAIDQVNGRFDEMARKAGSTGASTSASFDSITKSALKWGAAATAVAGAGLYLFKQIADGVDATNNLAKSLGISYNEMARLEYIAQQAGVQSGALTASLRIMNRTFGEIQTGGGEQARVALERLGLKIDDLEKMNATEKFQAVAGALRGIEDSATRAALANELFGKGAQQIMPLILDDAAALSKEFDGIGVTLTELDVQALDNAGDTLDKLQTTASLTAQKFAATLAPAIQAGAEALYEMVGGTGDLGEAATTAGNVMTFAIGKVLDILMGLKGVLDIATGALMHLGAFGIDVFETLLEGVNMVWKPFKTMINGWIEIHNLVFSDEKWALLGDLDKAVEATERFSSNLHDAGSVLAGKGFSEIGDAFSGKTSAAFFDRRNQAVAGSIGQTSGRPTVSDTELQTIKTDEEIKAEAKAEAKRLAEEDAHAEEMKRAEEWAEEKRVAALAEDEQLRAKYKADQEMLDTYLSGKLISEQSHESASKALRDKRDADLAASAAKRNKQADDEASKALAAQKANFRDQISSAAQHNKTFFELNKAVKLAEAALNIPAAVSGAYAVGAQLGGPVLGAAFGAAALSAQVINMQAIASQSFGGGGAASSVGGVGAAVSDPASSLPSAATQQSTAPRNDRVTTVSLLGDNFSRDGVRGLLTMLAEELADGGVLRTV